MNFQRSFILAASLFAVSSQTLFPRYVYGQIIPDNTLGAEASIVNPDGGDNLIQGGAIRGNALFHSFADFNVTTSQQVYFANPTGIDNILSRVTGLNPSQIDGLIGVSGNANLFLINPNGVIFGPEARLDVSGSFLASTSDRFEFTDGTEFRATNPNAAPLVSVNIPLGLQLGLDAPAALVNEADLAVGEDLTLVAASVTSPGQLSAPNGTVNVLGTVGDVQIQSVTAESAQLTASTNLILEASYLATDADLTLTAGQTVRIRDTIETPFLAIAGGNLHIQGDQEIDILALNHPQTPFQSGGNLTLMSDGPISGDAHFYSGMGFMVLDLAGNPGSYISYYDPIISVNGDVLFGDYTGVALKVEATGSIVADGNITITGADTTLVADGSGSDVDLLASQPALILRAGLTMLENAPTTLPTTVDTTVFNPTVSGLVPGSIQVVGNIDTPGGPIILAALGEILATGDISTFTEGDTGDITIQAGSDVAVNNITSDASFGDTGDISLTSDSGSITITGNIVAETTDGTGTTGDVTLRATDKVSIVGGSVFITVNDGGVTGDLRINTNSLVVQDAALLVSNPIASAGSIQITAGEVILDNGQLGTLTQQSADGNSGNIGINLTSDTETNILTLRDDSQITANNLDAAGSGGKITITANAIVAETPVEEGNDIFTLSASATGGAISIVVATLDNIEVRPELTSQNDIVGPNEVSIIEPDEPESPTVEEVPDIEVLALENETSGPTYDASDLRENDTEEVFGPADGCADSSVRQLGRGGLPTNPTDLLSATSIDFDWVSLQRDDENSDAAILPQSTTVATQPEEIKRSCDRS